MKDLKSLNSQDKNNNKNSIQNDNTKNFISKDKIRHKSNKDLSLKHLTKQDSLFYSNNIY